MSLFSTFQKYSAPTARPVAPLAVLGALAPTGAWAEACDKERPSWDGAAATSLDELLYLTATLPVLVLLAASALVIVLRSQWGGLAVIVLWTVLASVIILDKDPTRAAALEEGCIGSPALFVALVAAICVAIVLKTLPRPGTDPKSGEDNGDT